MYVVGNSYPGLISTHHHLFQSVMKGVRSGINLPLAGWLRSVPYTFWSKVDEEALAVAARIGLAEQRATHESVTRKLSWSAKSERCAMIVALIVTDVAV